MAKVNPGFQPPPLPLHLAFCQPALDETGCPILATLLFLWLGWAGIHSTVILCFLKLAFLLLLSFPPASATVLGHQPQSSWREDVKIAQGEAQRNPGNRIPIVSFASCKAALTLLFGLNPLVALACLPPSQTRQKRAKMTRFRLKITNFPQ
jgi:hypothetical protein